MVSYQAFVSIVFETAREKGAQFDGIEDGQPVMTLVSELWNENKQKLQRMTQAEAKRYAQEEVEVR